MQNINSKVVFKDYSPNQMMLFPPSLEEMIEEKHPVRVVNEVIDQINIQPVLSKYKGGGTSSYHPRMLLKVLVYSYLRNIYSSRNIESALKENVHFMWLSGMNKPDHNTINRFRGERLKDGLKSIFTQIVVLLSDSGLLSLEELYLDGTKIEANANRYSFVWGKSVKTRKEKLLKQVDLLWEYANKVAKEEMEEEEKPDFAAISPEDLENTIRKIDNALKGKSIGKEEKQKLSIAKKQYPERLEKYNEQENLLGSKRNSYSKTDPDATFMRMKEDHLKNGQLKPSYNLQVSSNSQFIINFSIHQNRADSPTLPLHMDQIAQQYSQLPQTLTADSGYGSEENYEYLKKNDIKGFVKYNYFHLEQTKKYKEDPFRQENLHYNAEDDCFYCPMGQKMEKVGQQKITNPNGFEQHIISYQAQNCKGCPLISKCHKGKRNRIITVNHKLRNYKEEARRNLMSEEGIKHRSKRPIDVEPIFGFIKQNKNFRRFNLRGREKVEIEVGLLSIAINLAKKAA